MLNLIVRAAFLVGLLRITYSCEPPGKRIQHGVKIKIYFNCEKF